MTTRDDFFKKYSDGMSAEAQARQSDMVKEMMQAIKQAENNLKEDVEKIIKAYQNVGGFSTRADALLWLNAHPTPADKSLLYEALARTNDPKKINEIMATLNSSAYQYRLTNRQLLKDLADIEGWGVFNKINKTMVNNLSEVTAESAAKSMFNIQKGVRAGWNFTQPGKAQLAAIMKNHYSPAWSEIMANGYSTRVKAIILGGVISGADIPRMSEQLSEATGAELWKCKRFARTQLTMAGNAGESLALSTAGISQYEFSCTLDERTCKECGALDGKIFNLNDRQQGKNYPPIHDNCRCWHHAVLSKKKQDQLRRAHRNPETGKTEYVPQSMKFEEWKAKYLQPPEDGTAEIIPDTIEPKVEITPLKPAELAGVKAGPNMTFNDADGGAVNPDFNKGKEYRINCQTCVVAYEARRRGFNVEALPKITQDQEILSRNTCLAWVDEDGNPPQPLRVDITARKQEKKEAELMTWFKESIKEGERHHLTICWKNSNSGHIVTIDREGDDIRLYDPQTGKTFKDIEIAKEYVQRIILSGMWRPELYRVDNLRFSPLVDNILKAARKK